MIRREIIITNKLGLHARPASQIVKTAAVAKAKFWIEKDGERINGKSILGVMMLAAAQGSKLMLEADGEDEQELIANLVKLFQNKFNED